jgi:hypothetical protein
MTDTELERLIDLTLTEFMSELDGMSAEDLQQVRNHPVVRYFTYRVCSDAQRQKIFPASEEYYLAQARIADRRWKFRCQTASLACCGITAS